MHLGKMETLAVSEERENEPETRCGVLGVFPEWLQFLASKKSYVVLFGLVGMNQFAISSYLVATITTLEKRFKIPSQTTGLIQGGWDIGTIFSSITMAYIGSKGHKTRWVALGTMLTSLACYSQLLPYIIYGPGSDALAIALSQNSSNGSSSSSWCGLGAAYTENCDEGDDGAAAPLLIFMSQFMLGIGTSMYWTLGVAYLDDNVKKSQAPWLIAISSTIRLFGSPLGFWVAAKALEYYADPSLNPPITNKDARWIGAWWLGWILFGMIATFYVFLLALFPRVLPRAPLELREKENAKLNDNKHDKIKGFKEMLKRLVNNPLLLCNTFSYVFYMFGVTGYWVFMPKYMETQFYMTASKANLVTGTMGLLSAALGVILSGYVLTNFKPSARKIAGWNCWVEAMGIISVLIYANLSCPSLKLNAYWDNDGSWNMTYECNSDCNCGPTVPFEPVCDGPRNITYYSPCHAGCTGMTYIGGKKVFTNCSCIPDPSTALDSFCEVDCQQNLMVFLVLYCLVSFFSSSSHAGLAIIQFRTVNPEDKSVSIALSEMMCSLLAYIPAPVVYGALLDSACLVWDKTCGETGNCWLYHGDTLRPYLNYTAAAFLSIALMFDVGVWYYSKNLALYDTDENEDQSTAIKENKDGSLTRREDITLQNLNT